MPGNHHKPRRTPGGALCCAGRIPIGPAPLLFTVFTLSLFAGCTRDDAPAEVSTSSSVTATPASTETNAPDAIEADTTAIPGPFEQDRETLHSTDALTTRSYAARLQRSQADSRSLMATYHGHFDAQRYDEAASTARDMLRERPDEPQLLYLLASAYHAAGNSARAEPSLARAVEFDPRHVNARKLLCIIMAADGRCTAAAEQIDELVALELADAEAFLLRASARFQCSDLANAEQDAAEALRLDPTMSPALLIRAGIRLRQGQPDAARSDLKAAQTAGVPEGHWQRFATELTAALDVAR